jgi:serine/threonine protein phosphatase PrpC
MFQISNVRLDPSEGGRLVLASDGLWDVIDTVKVHKIVKGQGQLP